MKSELLKEKDLPLYLPERYDDSNKGTYGKVLVISGAKNMAGAALLCAESAYRSGAGIVRVYTCEENRTIIQCSLPEALLSTYDAGALDVDALKTLIEHSSSVVIGPGLSKSYDAHLCVRTVLGCEKCPVVLDADALNIISEDRTLLADRKKGRDLILTPHMGEMTRLSGISMKDLKSDPARFSWEYADENNVILVLKDAKTHIAVPGDGVYVSTMGNNGMSTGGSGDVLAGIIGGFLAQDPDPKKAAIAGVLTHGMAGDIASSEYGVRSMLSKDIIDGMISILSKY